MTRWMPRALKHSLHPSSFLVWYHTTSCWGTDVMGAAFDLQGCLDGKFVSLTATSIPKLQQDDMCSSHLSAVLMGLTSAVIYGLGFFFVSFQGQSCSGAVPSLWLCSSGSSPPSGLPCPSSAGESTTTSPSGPAALWTTARETGGRARFPSPRCRTMNAYVRSVLPSPRLLRTLCTFPSTGTTYRT